METIARLSFKVRPEQIEAFSEVYERQLARLLKQYNMTAAVDADRPPAAGFFSRLFAVETPAAVAVLAEALARDPSWQGALQRLGAAFVGLHYAFEPCRTRAGQGTTTKAGSGFRQGLWHSFTAQDGSPTWINDLLVDRPGHLWLASSHNGVVRFDGAHFTCYTAADGLAHDWVRVLLEDGTGYLWLATAGGLCRFDGQHFETFTPTDGLAHCRVRALLEDRQGRLWVGTDQGLSCYDGRTWRTFTVQDGLKNNKVFSLLEDGQGRLWVGMDAGFSCYENGRFLPRADEADLGGRVIALVEDVRGTLWAGHDNGIGRFDGNRFVPVDILAGKSISALLVDGQDRLWLATGLDGVYCLDGGHWRHFSVQDGLVNDQVTALALDLQGNLWCGTQGGISRCDQGIWTVFTRADGLPHNGAVSALEDRQGRLWVGTFEGVCCREGGNFTHPEPVAGGGGWWSMLEDRRGHRWFGSAFGRGVIRYDGREFTSFTTAEGLVGNKVLCLLEDGQGRLWVGTESGLSIYDGQIFRSYTTANGLVHNQVAALLEDKQGRMWIGTRRGLSCYDGQIFRSYTDGLANPFVTCLLEDGQGQMWVKTAGAEIYRYDGQIFEPFNPGRALFGGEVRDILEDRQGHLWFPTYGGGIIRYDGCIAQTLTRADGLPTDFVQTVLQSRQGDFWIATEGGMARYCPATTPLSSTSRPSSPIATTIPQKSRWSSPIPNNWCSSSLRAAAPRRHRSDLPMSAGWKAAMKPGSRSTAVVSNTRRCRSGSTPFRSGPSTAISTTRPSPPCR